MDSNYQLRNEMIRALQKNANSIFSFLLKNNRLNSDHLRKFTDKKRACEMHALFCG